MRDVAATAPAPGLCLSEEHQNGGDDRRADYIEGAGRILPVRSVRKPTIYGPATPPSWPNELITAIATADDIPANKELDTDQKGAWRPLMPMAATVRAKMPIGILSIACDSASPPAARSTHPAVCQRRSPVRSEFQSTSSVNGNAARNGMADTSVVTTGLYPDIL